MKLVRLQCAKELARDCIGKLTGTEPAPLIRRAAALGATALLLAVVAIASTSRAVSRRDTSLMEVVEDPVGRASFRSLAAIPGARRERALEQVRYREAACGGAVLHFV